MIRIRLFQPLLSARGTMALDVDLEVQPGAFLAVTGPSGSGKTTLLRLIAGLARPKAGRIEFGGQIWLDSEQRVFMSPQRRRTGLVFQDYALFPNLTVRGNLLYPLERGQPAGIVEELIHIMEIEELVDRYPATLSGGQQQRVALARALVRRPDLLLLDEPLSALDAGLRLRLQDYLRRVHERFQLTTILVSHNPEEVQRLADRVIQLEEGRVVWQGAPLAQAGIVKLTGTILSVEHAETSALAYVRIGSEVVVIPVPSEQALQLQPGEEVKLVLGPVQPAIVIE